MKEIFFTFAPMGIALIIFFGLCYMLVHGIVSVASDWKLGRELKQLRAESAKRPRQDERVFGSADLDPLVAFKEGGPVEEPQGLMTLPLEPLSETPLTAAEPTDASIDLQQPTDAGETIRNEQDLVEEAGQSDLATVAGTHDEVPGDEVAVEQVPVDETPVDDVPVDLAPADEAPVDEAPVEEAPVEEAPVEEAPVEEAPVEEAPIEEAPIEEAPIEEAPVEEAPVDEAPVEEAPVDEAPVEEAPVEEAPVDEAPVEEAPVDEAPVDETPVDETPVDEAPVDEAPVDEAPDNRASIEDDETYHGGNSQVEVISERPGDSPAAVANDTMSEHSDLAPQTLASQTLPSAEEPSSHEVDDVLQQELASSEPVVADDSSHAEAEPSGDMPDSNVAHPDSPAVAAPEIEDLDSASAESTDVPAYAAREQDNETIFDGQELTDDASAEPVMDEDVVDEDVVDEDVVDEDVVADGLTAKAESLTEDFSGAVDEPPAQATVEHRVNAPAEDAAGGVEAEEPASTSGQPLMDTAQRFAEEDDSAVLPSADELDATNAETDSVEGELPAVDEPGRDWPTLSEAMRHHLSASDDDAVDAETADDSVAETSGDERPSDAAAPDPPVDEEVRPHSVQVVESLWRLPATLIESFEQPETPDAEDDSASDNAAE